MKSVKYLVELQKMTGMNDSELAKSLNLSHGAISHYKTGKRVMDDETCGKVAYQLNIDPMLIVAAACIDRAEKTGQKSIWEVFISRMATAASVILAVNLFLTPTPSEAARHLAQENASICIM